MRIVFITAPPDQARNLARTLVTERLCACVNVVPEITSHYIWEGKAEEERESLLIAKVSADRVDAFTERVKALHTYDTPEILAMEPVGGNPDYLDWVRGGGG